MPTLVIDNFGGRLTRYQNGDINSGLAKFFTTFGNDPFSKPGRLTWNETATQIDAAGAVITDLIMDGKERVESGISYLYAIGHTGRLYKIQVNDPTTYNPNYDNPVLLTTLVSGTPTFTRGASLDFFGATEKIYIGHDKGVTSINFDGTGEVVVGLVGSWTQTVPKPVKEFVGNLYIGNGSNIAEISSLGIVNTYTKLSPGFPSGTQVRDLDVSTDGNYLNIVVSRLALPDLTSIVQDTTLLTNGESYIFKWNGVDTGYTSFDSFPSFSLNSNIIFGDNQYAFGYDLAGSIVYADTNKILTLILSQSPTPNAIGSNGNLVGWEVPEFYQGFLRMSEFIYGSLDNEVSIGLWRQFAFSASGTETDVVRVPFGTLVSNFGIGSSSNGYFAGVFALGKAYYSSLETSAAPTLKYKFYKYFPVATGFGTSLPGVYETQTEIFSKKQAMKEIRVYGEPWAGGNGFKIDLIDSAGNPIANGTITFTAGANLTIGDDRVWFDAGIAPTYAVAVRVTNTGSRNHTINKIEIDYEPAGE